MRNWKAFAGYTVMALLLTGLFVPYECYGAITIPNTIEVDAFGGALLTSAAPAIISVVTLSVLLLMVVIVKRVIFRKGAAIAK